MHKLALFTPWPPQHSGIADYSYDLAIGLASRGTQVNVFTDELAPAQAGHDIRLSLVSKFPGPQHFDQIIYQMGNNAQFHSSMIEPLGAHGGIVHLHDMVLHHLVHDLTSQRGQGQLYYRLLQHWYGADTLDRVHRWNKTNDCHFIHSGGITDVPLFEPILRFADGCIVHSEFCRRQVTARFPKLPCEVVSQTYLGAEITDKSSHRETRIGVFGGVSPGKHVDKLIMAVAEAVTLGADIHVDVAGNLDCGGKALLALVDQLNIQDRVTFHGRVSKETLLSLMRSVDVCVALRFPTMGETSGIVSRAVQMGLPTIVNDIGWYAELPPFVEKLPLDAPTLQRQLLELLVRHATNPDFHQRVRDEATCYAREAGSFDRICERYRSIISSLPKRPATDHRAHEAA